MNLITQYTYMHMYVHICICICMYIRKRFTISILPDSNSKISLENRLLPTSILTSLQTPMILLSLFIIRMIAFNIL